MKIHLRSPIALHQKGRRNQNEDNIYPTLGEATKDSRVFVVCDGVGGEAKGELASEWVAQGFGRAFEKQLANRENLDAVLNQIQKKIDNYLIDNQLNRGMATTLSFLQFNPQGATIAHAGDSRVYHFRGGKILFCTTDHSLINDLRKKGLYKEADEAKSNVITRAIQGNTIKPIKLDIHFISDIQKGDCFLLCTDGVWGVLTDAQLMSILTNGQSNLEKIAAIEQVCGMLSKDNFSAYLIEIERVEQVSDSHLPSSDTTIPMVNPNTVNTDKKMASDDVTTLFQKPYQPKPSEPQKPIQTSQARILVENTAKPRRAKWLVPSLVGLIFCTIFGGIAYNLGFFSTKTNTLTTTDTPILTDTIEQTPLNSENQQPKSTPSVSAHRKHQKVQRREEREHRIIASKPTIATTNGKIQHDSTGKKKNINAATPQTIDSSRSEH